MFYPQIDTHKEKRLLPISKKTGANSRLQMQVLEQKAQITQLTVSPDNAAIKQVQLSYQNIADQVRDT